MAESPKRLIVNADDLGWSRSVDLGILEAHECGIVTSASLMAPGGSFEHAVSLVRGAPDLDVGVHLSFYRGEPVLPPSDIPTLLGPDGRFLGSWKLIVARLMARRLDLGELEAELRAQIDRVRAAGVTPTHLDGEKHLHLWPTVFPIVCRLAVACGVPEVRVVREPATLRPVPAGLTLLSRSAAAVASRVGLRTPDATVGVTANPISADVLEAIMAGARAPRVEFVTHPGHIDDEFMALQRTVANRLVASREAELAALTDPRARAVIAAAGYTLARRADVPAQ